MSQRQSLFPKYWVDSVEELTLLHDYSFYTYYSTNILTGESERCGVLSKEEGKDQTSQIHLSKKMTARLIYLTE